MNEDTEFIDDDSDEFPWEDIEAARKDLRLQKPHPVSEGKTNFLSQAKPCPKCQTPADKLSWFFFESPKWTWDNLCGQAGWMTVCDQCRLQVDFFLDHLN